MAEESEYAYMQGGSFDQKGFVKKVSGDAPKCGIRREGGADEEEAIGAFDVAVPMRCGAFNASAREMR